MVRFAIPCFISCALLIVSYAKAITDNNINHVDCMDAYQKCRERKACRSSYRNVGSTCTVIDGRCGAKMKHLPACAKIMDDLFAYGFPESRCVCDKDTTKCRDIQEKIYKNPCFVSIKHLRRMDLFPHDVTDSRPTVKPVHVKSTSSNDAHAQSTEKRKDQRPTDTAHKEITADLSTTTKTTIVGVSKTIGSWCLCSLNVNNYNICLNNGIHINEGQLQDIDKDHKTKILDKDQTDYKLLTIIFASLLGLFLVVGVTFFAWTRVRDKWIYTNGKQANNCSEERSGSLQKAKKRSSSNNNITKD